MSPAASTATPDPSEESTDEANEGSGAPSAAGSDDGSAPGSAASATRDLHDPREMRALTHPTRLALLEVLSTEGPMTATEAGDRIGESASTCSFHLRQLAKYGFVVEAGGGEGRRRPWKIVNRSLRFVGSDEAEELVAANELGSALLHRWVGRHRAWTAVEHSEPEWAAVTGASQHVAYVTPDELATMREDIEAILARFNHRLDDPDSRPEGSRAIETVRLMHPFNVKPEG